MPSDNALPLRTIVYIDAFNLYYRRLKGTPYKWLNLETMCQMLLPDNKLEQINYYSARITDPDKYSRQDAYLRALATLPIVSVTYGRYVTHSVPRRLAVPPVRGSAYVNVINNEEKGSDVNLATHLVLDGCRNKYDVAVVISNDSDLEEPIRVAKHELGKVVGILSPLQGRMPSSPQLIRHADFVKRIKDKVLKASQFPITLQDKGGDFHKPSQW